MKELIAALRSSANALLGIEGTFSFFRLADNNREAADILEAIDWFSDNQRLELTHYTPVYCDDSDQAIEWRVHEQQGSINDREWYLRGKGDTAIAAIQDAMKNMQDVDYR